MANPFNVFRKNQKAALAVLGVLAMVSFVVLPIVQKLLGAGRGGGSEVVVQCEAFGDLTQMELRVLQTQRQKLAGFLRYAMRLLAEDQERPPMALQRMYQQINNFEWEDLAHQWMLARYAQQKGIRVSDESIVILLNELFEQRLSSEQLMRMLQELGIHEDTLFAELRDYLLTRQLMMSMGLTLDSATPGQRWEWFKRLNREVAIEAAMVPVDSLTDQIETPEESVLREFFETHKNDIQEPSSPETGFAIPKKVAVEYFVVSMENLDTEAVPESEVEEYYEENKNQLFRKESFSSFEGINTGTSDLTEGGPALPGLDSQGEFPLNPPAESPEEGEQGTEEDSNTNSPTASEAEQNDGQESSEANREAPNDPPQIGGSSESGLEEESESEPTEEEATESDASETSSVTSPSWLRMVSYQEEASAPSEEAEENDVSPPAERETEKEGKPDEESSEVKGDSETEQMDAPGETTEADQEPPEIQMTDDTPPEDTSNLYKPLSEVEDQIRRTLARQKRVEKVELLEGMMNRYFQDYVIFLADERNPKPAPLDFTALAEEYGFVAKETELLDIHAFSKLDLADAQIDQGTTVVDVLFHSDLSDYEVFRATDPAGNMYLLWVLASTERRIPKFSEVKDEVLKRWKEVQARQLAREKAQRLAKEARDAQEPLRSVFAERDDVPVVESDFFSWLTYGDLQPWQLQMYGYQIPPQVSPIKEKVVPGTEPGAEGKQDIIVAPGNDFMRQVFSLQVDQVGVAVNQPETAAYVVRVLDTRPDGTQLWEEFQQASYQTYRSASRSDTQEVMEAWEKQVEKETGYEWIGVGEEGS